MAELITHRGHQIAIDGSTLTIDGASYPIDPTRDGRFGSMLLPHSLYASVADLATALIDFAPQFSGRRDI